MSKNQKILTFIFYFFCFSIFSSISQSNEGSPLNNMVINEIPKPVSTLIFEDFSGKKINLNDYYGKLLIINLWATWCVPCKKEMPSLDKLQQDSAFKNLKVLAVNVEQPNHSKAKNFFDKLDIKNLNIYFDSNLNFVKEFNLRGVPTTLLMNKNGEEFARIIGEVDFQDEKFLKWLSKYD